MGFYTEPTSGWMSLPGGESMTSFRLNGCLLFGWTLAWLPTLCVCVCLCVCVSQSDLCLCSKEIESDC